MTLMKHAGNGNTAERVEHTPLLRVALQPGTILLQAGQLQCMDTPPDPFAYLRANLAKTGPAHVQLRQGPLQEVDALCITCHAFDITIKVLPPVNRLHLPQYESYDLRRGITRV